MHSGEYLENLSADRWREVRREREEIVIQILDLSKKINAKKGGIRFVPKDKFAWYPTQKQW